MKDNKSIQEFSKDELSNEVWRDIDDYYQVSNLGRIRSQKGLVKPTLRKDTGYLVFNMHRGNLRRVHRVVAEAFIPNPENKRCINHIDGDKTNNRVSNLEWCTHSENEQHAWDTGLITNDFRRKLTDLQEKACADLYRTGKYSLTDIGNIFGVCHSLVSKVVKKQGVEVNKKKKHPNGYRNS